MWAASANPGQNIPAPISLKTPKYATNSKADLIKIFAMRFPIRLPLAEMLGFDLRHQCNLTLHTFSKIRDI